jgi:hypothetical protein
MILYFNIVDQHDLASPKPFDADHYFRARTLQIRNETIMRGRIDYTAVT